MSHRFILADPKEPIPRFKTGEKTDDVKVIEIGSENNWVIVTAPEENNPDKPVTALMDKTKTKIIAVARREEPSLTTRKGEIILLPRTNIIFVPQDNITYTRRGIGRLMKKILDARYGGAQIEVSQSLLDIAFLSKMGYTLDGNKHITTDGIEPMSIETADEITETIKTIGKEQVDLRTISLYSHLNTLKIFMKPPKKLRVANRRSIKQQ